MNKNMAWYCPKCNLIFKSGKTKKHFVKNTTLYIRSCIKCGGYVYRPLTIPSTFLRNFYRELKKVKNLYPREWININKRKVN